MDDLMKKSGRDASAPLPGAGRDGLVIGILSWLNSAWLMPALGDKAPPEALAIGALAFFFTGLRKIAKEKGWF